MSGYIGNIPVPQATQTRDNFTATSGQTTFSTSGYTPSYLDVYLNGVHLDPSDYTATNGTDVVLGTGATAGDVLEVVAFSTFEAVDQDFSGDFSVDGSTFVVDSTNDRIGIGTASPETSLDVVAANTLGSSMTGTTVGQGIRVSQSSYTSGNYVSLIEGTYTDGGSGADVRIAAMYDSGGSNLSFGVTNSYGQINKEAMFIDSSGNVGIGTSNPAAKLDVRNVADGEATVAIFNNINAALTDQHYLEILADNTNNHVKFKSTGTNSGSYIFATGNTERMRIDSSGRVTMPYQPSFNAYSPAITSQGNIIVFSNTFHNTGSHYNTSTGVFTAPVAGVYQFNFSVLLDTGVSYHRVLFRVNGSISTAYGDTLETQVSGTVYSSATNSISIYLSANDTVSVYNNGSDTYGSSYGNFSGHLVG